MEIELKNNCDVVIIPIPPADLIHSTIKADADKFPVKQMISQKINHETCIQVKTMSSDGSATGFESMSLIDLYNSISTRLEKEKVSVVDESETTTDNIIQTASKIASTIFAPVTRNSFCLKLELNCYPLLSRYKVLDLKLLDEIKKRKNVDIRYDDKYCSISNDKKFYLLFEGGDIESVRDAKNEIKLILRHEIITLPQLEIRDLFKLANSDDMHPYILVRQNIFLFSWGCIRALISHSVIYIINNDGTSSPYFNDVIGFAEESICNEADISATYIDSISKTSSTYSAKGNKAHQYRPFEQLAFEAIISSVVISFNERCKGVNREARDLAEILRSKPFATSITALKVHELKSRVTDLESETIAHSSCLEGLIDDDLMMAHMNLEYLKKNKLYVAKDSNPALDPLVASVSQVIELLAGGYVMELHKVSKDVARAHNALSGAESMVSVMMDSAQTKLLMSNTAITFLSCGIGFCGYISGLFGMNLDNTIFFPPMKNSFLIVCVLTGIFILFTGWATALYIVRVEAPPENKHA